MIYKVQKDQKKIISWTVVLVLLGLIVALGLGSINHFFYLIGLVLIFGAVWIFVNRKKAYFEIHDQIIKVGRLQVLKSSIVDVDCFASDDGASPTTIVLKLDQSLDVLVGRSLNIFEKYFNKSFALGPKQLSIDFESARELKKHLSLIQEWRSMQ